MSERGVAVLTVPTSHLSTPAVPLIYFAERINGLAARHWRSFAKQNYFDSQVGLGRAASRHACCCRLVPQRPPLLQGIFTSAMLSAPLLLIMFVILVCDCVPACLPACVLLRSRRCMWAALPCLGCCLHTSRVCVQLCHSSMHSCTA